MVLDGRNLGRWSTLIKLLFVDQKVLEIRDKGNKELWAELIDVQKPTFKDSKNKGCKLLF